MKKRQSTTAKITRKIANLIQGYVTRTGSGVIVRYSGKELGITADNFDAIPLSRCTIRKTTIETLQKWFDRYSAVYDLIASDRNGTAGSPAHRYIVSRRGGIETVSLRSLTPYVVSRFIDDTLESECVGLWKSEDGVYCLDSNVSFDRFPTAARFGRENNQIAIFDNVAQCEILC